MILNVAVIYATAGIWQKTQNMNIALFAVLVLFMFRVVNQGLIHY